MHFTVSSIYLSITYLNISLPIPLLIGDFAAKTENTGVGFVQMLKDKLGILDRGQEEPEAAKPAAAAAPVQMEVKSDGSAAEESAAATQGCGCGGGGCGDGGMQASNESGGMEAGCGCGGNCGCGGH